MRSNTFPTAISVAVLILTISPTTSAQTTIWGLQPGDNFRIQTTVERQNTLQIDQTDKSVRKTTDRLIFEYRVLRVLPGEDLSIQVRVIQAVRHTGEADDDADHADAGAIQQLPGLRKIVVIATVDPDGLIRELSAYDNAINQLLESHQSGDQLLDQSVSEEVFTSWISYPFWLPAAGAKSEHSHDLSLGLLGQLRTTVTCQTGQPERAFAQVTITGDARHIAPTSVGRKLTNAPVAFTNIQAKIDSFGGQGTVAVPAVETDSITEPEEEPLVDPIDEPDLEPVDEPNQEQNAATATKRPLFEGLTLELSCSGQATLQVGDSQRTLQFQQQQKVSSKLLPGYRIGRRPPDRLFIRP